MVDLFKLLGKIIVDNTEANKSLGETTEKAKETGEQLGKTGDDGEKSGGKLSKAFSAVGKGALAVGKVVGTGMIAAGTAVSGLVAKSVQAYAEYEQLVGGVETLFKDSASNVMDNANKAFLTAGLSANAYMETVTSFSASLLQSLGGDTEKAASYADRAIIDMSDNANKMGTSMDMIQNAYNGFAKQNYTMLDNLKLGYGGTKEEMERLIAKASKMKDVQKELGITVDSNSMSFGNIVNAISVMQKSMGITGTTAQEASRTISGSLGAMKGAWTNLVTAMANDELPFDEYVASFVESVSTFAGNIIPRVQIALTGAVSLIGQLAPVIFSAIPGLIESIFPAIVDAAFSLMSSLIEMFPNLLSVIVAALPDFMYSILDFCTELLLPGLVEMFSAIVAELPELLPMIIDCVLTLTRMLAFSLVDLIHPIIQILPSLLVEVTTELAESLPWLLDGIGMLIVEIAAALPQLMEAIFSVLPEILVMIGKHLIIALPLLWSNLKEALSILWQWITDTASNLTSKLFGKIEEWIRQLFPKSADTVMKILGTIRDYFSTLVRNIGQILSVVVSVISQPFKLAWNGVKLIWDVCVSYFKLIWENVKAIFSVVDSVLAGDFQGAWDGIKRIFSNVGQFFRDCVSHIGKAISNAGEILLAPFRKAKDAIGNIVDNIKGFFSNLKLRFPNIPLPHFKVKPDGWKIGDLLKGSIPSLGIDWYAKAMDNPLVMSKPTIFGYNPASGRFQGGGEAGTEVVSGVSTLMNMIQTAVAEKNEELVYYLQKLVEILATFFPQVLERAVVLDTGATVGALAIPMNEALGKISARKDRGR